MLNNEAKQPICESERNKKFMNGQTVILFEFNIQKFVANVADR